MEPPKRENITIKVYKYRWVVLGIYCFFTIINFMQFLQFTIIANIVIKYYNVSAFAVDASGLVFFIIYIFTFLPISYLIEKYSLKVTAVTSSGLTLVGNLLKLLCAHQDKFRIAFLGQTLCAIGQVYMISIPTKFASTWFGSEEVSTACAIAVLGTQLGAAIGCVLPSIIVKNGEPADVGKQLFHMFTIYAIISAVAFITTGVFFRAHPELPPSHSQLVLLETSSSESFFKDLKGLIKNRDFLLLLLSFGLTNGIWNSFGILLNNVYLNFFPSGESDAGLIGLIAIISGGCIGSLVFGVILDKTHYFKRTSFLVLLASSLTLILVTYVLLAKHRIGCFITIPIFGFFTASTLVIGFEYVLEVTYPVPESCGCSVLNAVIFTFAIVVTLILESLLTVIGYLYSFVIIFLALLGCCLTVLAVSPNLHRRDANSRNKQEMGVSNESYSNENTI